MTSHPNTKHYFEKLDQGLNLKEKEKIEKREGQTERVRQRHRERKYQTEDRRTEKMNLCLRGHE